MKGEGTKRGEEGAGAWCGVVKDVKEGVCRWQPVFSVH
jgi:hypothetical protein